MSGSGGPTAHRASASRVIPAIPLILEARSRRSLEQNIIPQHGHPESQSGKQPEAIHSNDDGKASAHAKPAEARHIVTVNGTNREARGRAIQSGSESSQQTDAAQSTQSNDVNSADATSEPQSSTSTSFGANLPPNPVHLRGPVLGLDANVGLASAQKSSPDVRDVLSSATLQPSPGILGPQPTTASFVPTEDTYRSAEPRTMLAHPPLTGHTTGFIHLDRHQPNHTPRGSNVQSKSDHPGHVLQPTNTLDTNQFDPNSGQILPTTFDESDSDSTKAIHPTLLQTTKHESLGVSHPPAVYTSARPPHSRTFRALDNSPPSIDPEASFMTAAYLLDQFGVTEFADYVLLISHSQSIFTPITLPAHAVVLARSPKLRRLLKHSGALLSRDTLSKEMTIVVSDAFLNNSQALATAIKRLYSGELPNPMFVTATLGLRSPSECMSFALSYAAAGHYLEIDEIINCGLHLANHFLNLDTVDLALAFAIDGGIGISWSSPESMNAEQGHQKLASEQPQFPTEPPSSTTPTYGIYSDFMLRHILTFVTRCLGPHFTFDAKSPQLAACPRLPQDLERRHNRSSSRLSQIRFGEMQSTDNSVADEASRSLSSILLSLPYPLLKQFLEHDALVSKLDPKFVADTMRAVVDEREARRRRASQHSKSTGSTSSSDEMLLLNLCWSERVEQSPYHRCGFSLSRRQIAPDTAKYDDQAWKFPA